MAWNFRMLPQSGAEAALDVCEFFMDEDIRFNHMDGKFGNNNQKYIF